jgi:PEGA domain
VRSRLIIILLAGGSVLLGALVVLRVLRQSGPAAPPAPPVASRVEVPAVPARSAGPLPAPKRPAPRRPNAAGPAPPPPAAAPAEATPTTGTLHIESDVPDASVFIDRVYLGSVPVTASNLTPGPHELHVSATGYDPDVRTIQVEAGTRDLVVKFKEIRLDASVPVVHRHAMGSCSGTLTATPQGLTYDTTNTKDAFTVPLTHLETFEVDYLNKTLKVKVRGGRTYNFTDADGKVDRLYLFWEDVDKVRQRLLAGK